MNKTQKGGGRKELRLLGIDPNQRVDKNMIMKAYRKKSLKVHPDRNKGPLAIVQQQEVNDARDILIDKLKNGYYQASPSPPQPSRSESSSQGIPSSFSQSPIFPGFPQSSMFSQGPKFSGFPSSRSGFSQGYAQNYSSRSAEEDAHREARREEDRRREDARREARREEDRRREDARRKAETARRAAEDARRAAEDAERDARASEERARSVEEESRKMEEIRRENDARRILYESERADYLTHLRNMVIALHPGLSQNLLDIYINSAINEATNSYPDKTWNILQIENQYQELIENRRQYTMLNDEWQEENRRMQQRRQAERETAQLLEAQELQRQANEQAIRNQHASQAYMNAISSRPVTNDVFGRLNQLHANSIYDSIARPPVSSPVYSSSSDSEDDIYSRRKKTSKRR